MTQLTPKPRKPLWRSLLKWTLRVVVVLIVLGIAAYAITSYWAAKTINNEIARIRAAGEPLTFAELKQRGPTVEHAQDATPFYAAAEALLNTEHETGGATYDIIFGRKPLPTPLPPDVLPWAHKALDLNATTLELLDRGSALPGCTGGIQLEYGIAVALPHLGSIRGLLNVATLRTRTFAIEGHPDQAVDSLISSLGLLRMLDRQPILIGTLVQIALLARGSDDTAFILNYAHPSDAALQKLAAALRGAHIVEPHQMFIAERVYVLEVSRSLIANGNLAPASSDDVPMLPERQQLGSLDITGRIMIANYLPTFARYIDGSRSGFPGALEATQKISDSATSIFAKVTGPSFSHALVIYARSLATQRAAVIAVEIERYRLAHGGQLPETLEKLPGDAEFPSDPFTGKPLLYVKTADGYCVMSAGRNHPEDDGRHIDRDADPIGWSERWGIHIRTAKP